MITFISSFLGATLLYFTFANNQLPNGWRGLVYIIILIFLIKGIDSFIRKIKQLITSGHSS
uniref:Uncharacterized protein n=1 Tax=Vibrio sp. FF_371 TaxID=1652835 RepID=A0A0H3ZKU1_9VIBR|nr:hypothetical protein [Vibrio sp. FF_371]